MAMRIVVARSRRRCEKSWVRRASHGTVTGYLISNPSQRAYQRLFSSPGPLPGAVEFFQCGFRLECLRLAGEGARAQHAHRGVGAGEFRPFAAAVGGKSGRDVGSNAGVGAAIAAYEQIQPPILGHADSLPHTAGRANQGEDSCACETVRRLRPRIKPGYAVCDYSLGDTSFHLPAGGVSLTSSSSDPVRALMSASATPCCVLPRG
jgi:hypothetical protein